MQEKASSYTTTSNAWNISIKAGFNPKPSLYDLSLSYYLGPPANADGILLQTTYTDGTDHTFLSSDTTRLYNGNDQTKVVQTVNNYQYDPQTYQLTQLKTVNSKNEMVTQTITYPNNYTSIAKLPTYLNGVKNLAGNGIVSYPIEEITQKSNADGSNLRTVKAVLTTYKDNRPYRDSVFLWRSLLGSNIFVNSTTGVKDSHYQPILSFDKYDLFGNIQQEKKLGDALHTYIWGYPNANFPHNNTYPIAEVINADSASVAYTNFESYNSNGQGNWVYNTTGTVTDATAPMGAQCYNVSNTNSIVKSGLNSTVGYVVSFWAKSGAIPTVSGGTIINSATGNIKSGWIYNEFQVNGTTAVTIGGSGLIDELRLYPVNAQMSTYTYIPLVGIASKCDIKNDITYYNYDNVGRLSFIQDQNRNIVKQMNYHYQGQ